MPKTRHKTRGMNSTEAEQYTRLVSKSVIIINELKFKKEEEKRCNTAIASTTLLIPIPATYSGAEFKEDPNGKITPKRRTEEKIGKGVQQKRTVLRENRIQRKTNSPNQEIMYAHNKNKDKTTNTNKHAHRPYTNIHRGRLHKRRNM